MNSSRHRSAVETRPIDARDLDALVDEMRSHARGSASPVRVISGYIARSPVAALVADDAGYFTAVNLAASRLTGFSREEILRRSVTDLTAPPDAAVRERLWNSFVRADHQRGTYAILRKDGEVILVHYDAYASIAPGAHLSFLRPVNSAGGRPGR